MSKFKRGNSTNLPSPSDGNIIYCKDTHQLLVDDASKHNGISAASLNSNGNTLEFDSTGDLSPSKSIKINGKDITDVVSYEGYDTSLSPLYPCTYETSGSSYDVFTVGKNIIISPQEDGSILLENRTTVDDNIRDNNSIIICKHGGSMEWFTITMQIKNKDSVYANVGDMIPKKYCNVYAGSQTGSQTSYAGFPVGFDGSIDSSNNKVTVSGLLLSEDYNVYILVPPKCSCYIKDITVDYGYGKISQLKGSKGLMDPLEYNNIKLKTDKIINSFNGTSYNIIPFLVYSHTVSTSDWSGNTAKLPIQQDILDIGETPFILGYDVLSESDFDMCANAKITISNYPDYDSGSDSYYYTITAYGEVPTKSIKIYYTITIDPISV